ncbi:hypothetical protein [Amycolatopsis jiangsuensis]|uniref:Uncharacterized protein n=1 Tax=Amycolatopsis jiangsuensis TaxID=1181879 RepID=A0A840IMR7_9PSEU|nr:hypothetical protein [Amycolatopsis jiangsuensis]MBB4683240.1 hypothetical protein [Amycolatopsis jiangsuensis]
MTDEVPAKRVTEPREPVVTEEHPAEAVKQRLQPMLSGTKLRDMAKTGSFAVDDSTGDKMIAALEGVVDSLQARWDALQKLGTLPAMSQSAAGRWVGGHMLATASDSHGLLTQLQAARDEFPTYVEAIKLAKKNYHEREQDAQDTFRRLPDAPEAH